MHTLEPEKGHRSEGKGVRRVWPELGRIWREAAGLISRGQAQNGVSCQEFELE